MVLAGLFARVTRRLGIFGRPELIGVDVKRVIDGIVPLMIDFRRLGTQTSFPFSLLYSLTIRQSEIAPAAGRGVFASRSHEINSHSSAFPPFRMGPIPAGSILCMYPGRYVPPPPRWTLPIDGSLPAGGKLLLYEHSPHNAYVLSLEEGGTIDADGDLDRDMPGFSENPFACGHLINHASDCLPNVTSVAFRWADVCPHFSPSQSSSPSSSFSSSSTSLSPSSLLPRHTLPNVFEYQPNTPWCLDASTNQIVHLPAPPSSEHEAVHVRELMGTAMVALRDIEPGEELLLDYDLRGPPYPEWARDWFKPSHR